MDNSKINNDFYHSLEKNWYENHDHPVALLRAEAKLKNPWVKEKIEMHYPQSTPPELRILDVACGGGFLSNYLAQAGYRVTGIDTSEPSLRIARQYDLSKKAEYVVANAYELPFPDQSFEVVTCMDFLEHVEDPARVVKEAARVLKPGGIFIFHTFNRNWLAGLVVIKGVEWFVKNVPPHMHVLSLFVKPSELKKYCAQAGLKQVQMLGIAPQIWSRAFWKLIFTKKVDQNFSFKFTRSLKLGYLGFAR